jgi:ribosomal protein L11 methyltransferase
MPWLKIEMQLEAAVAEALSDALLELGAQSVTIEDAWADTPAETARYGEPGFETAVWRDTRLCALVDMQSDAAALTRAAAVAVGLQAAPAYAVTLVEDDDWVRRTQSQFSPIRIGKRLWIVPSWCEPPQSEGAVIVRLDPGLAFGTGSHATTRLMLAWLEGTLEAEPRATSRVARRVLDYGCGSGILALAAAKLGASDVVAIDVDPRALEACTKNALANEASIRIEPPERVPAGSYDLVLANILAQPLIDLAPVFAAHTHAGAQIALSGVLAEQAEEVIAAYRVEFALRIDAVAEGWALLAGKRR